MKDINEIKEKLNKLKDLESAITGIDFSNPKKMFETLNVFVSPTTDDVLEKYALDELLVKVILP